MTIDVVMNNAQIQVNIRLITTDVIYQMMMSWLVKQSIFLLKTNYFIFGYSTKAWIIETTLTLFQLTQFHNYSLIHWYKFIKKIHKEDSLTLNKTHIYVGFADWKNEFFKKIMQSKLFREEFELWK